jgi:predicted anti-sigma-YlaC factor YlaD
MNCEQARDLMHDALDGIISAGGRGQLDEHLNACDACRAEFHQLLEMDRGLADLRAMTELPVNRSRVAAPIFRPHHVTRAAAAIVILLGGGLLVRTTMKTERMPVPVGRPAAPAAVASAVVTLTDESADRYLAEVVDSGEPGVHIIWLHPAVGGESNTKEQPTGRSVTPSQPQSAMLASAPTVRYRR